MKHPAITELRGQGLMFAAEVGSFDFVLKAMHAGIRRGVLFDWFLSMDYAFRIGPPITITEAELHAGIDLVLAALDEVWEGRT